MATTKTETRGTVPSVNMGKGPSGEDMPDFDKWDQIQTGFAPYWNPEEGAFCYGEVVAKDARDPEFVRYLIKAHATTKCSRGPKDDNGVAAEVVIVKPGETFSFSSYHALAMELDFQIHLRQTKNAIIPVMIKALRQSKTNTAGRTVWHWDVRNAPEHTPLLNQHRTSFMEMSDGGATRPALDDKSS